MVQIGREAHGSRVYSRALARAASVYDDGKPILRRGMCIPHRFTALSMLAAAAYKYTSASTCVVCKQDLRKSLVRCQGTSVHSLIDACAHTKERC